jgi:glycosidase
MTRKAVILSSLLVLVSTLALADPTVHKVDPPNWFIGRGNPMLLLYGEQLTGAHVTTNSRMAKVRATEVSANGHYLIVQLDVSIGAQPGTIPLTVKTPQGQTEVTYRIDAHRNIADGFSGLASNDVLYLLMPDRFADGDSANNNPRTAPNTYDRAQAKWYHGGDLKGVRQKLPYLKDLGVTAIWMTPFVDNENTSGYDGYHGYGAIDMYAVDEHYGTLKDVQDLVADAHKVGMKIVFDWVANHTGPRHPWVADPPTPTWFHGSMQKHIPPDYEFPPMTNPHATPATKTPITDGWFADILADLNQDDPRVAQYLSQNAIWWAEQTGVDAYRLDTFPYVPRTFWAGWHKQLHSVYPRLDTVGENFNKEPTVVAYFLGGRTVQGVDTGLNMAFDFPLMTVMRDVFSGKAPVTRIADVLQRDWIYPNASRLVPMLGNHDTSRFITEAGGNGQSLKNATALLLTMRGIPQLYYGDEIGMAGGGDPECRRDFPGGFPGDTNNAFTDAGRTPEQRDVFNWTQKLLKVRQEHRALTEGQMWNLAVDETSYVFLRDNAADRVVVAFNNADAARKVTINESGLEVARANTWTTIAGEGSASREGDGVVVSMPPRSVTLIEAK